MPLHFLQIKRHLKVLIVVSIAEKLDDNTLYYLLYFSFGNR